MEQRQAFLLIKMFNDNDWFYIMVKNINHRQQNFDGKTS